MFLLHSNYFIGASTGFVYGIVKLWQTGHVETAFWLFLAYGGYQAHKSNKAVSDKKVWEERNAFERAERERKEQLALEAIDPEERKALKKAEIERLALEAIKRNERLALEATKRNERLVLQAIKEKEQKALEAPEKEKSPPPAPVSVPMTLFWIMMWMGPCLLILGGVWPLGLLWFLITGFGLWLSREYSTLMSKP